MTDDQETTADEPAEPDEPRGDDTAGGEGDGLQEEQQGKGYGAG